MDRPLASELGLDRNDRHAVGLGAAITAVLAHPIIDDDALRRIGEGLALAPAPLLGGAGLVVHQHGNTRKLAQLALDCVQLTTMPDRHAAGYA